MENNDLYFVLDCLIAVTCIISIGVYIGFAFLGLL